MVDASAIGNGGVTGSTSCRCACVLHDGQYNCDETAARGCCCRCSPHLFTSVLLGVLACVLMTGGVFLAFHRWDPLWLIVSAVGVVLVLIGSLLHCCASAEEKNNRARSGKGGCCGRPPNDHLLHGHHLASNGGLTEQLLPLSNARSVSQLSLNMLPGYFPPVVTGYGIEQHSAVVQNIGRLVQQQQQSAGSTCSTGPGGKSFILLSLPSDANTSNIQNLVATVYQLDGSVEAPTADSPTPATQSSVNVNQSSPIPLLLKNAEVQTCSAWPSAISTLSTINPPLTSSASTSTCNISAEPSILAADTQTPSTGSGHLCIDLSETPPRQPINLMDCPATEIPPVCDNNQSSASQCEIPSNTLPPALATAVTSVQLVEISTSSEHLDVPAIATPSFEMAEEVESVLSDLSNVCTTSAVVDIAVSSSALPVGENVNQFSEPPVNGNDILINDIDGNNPRESDTSTNVLIDVNECTTAVSNVNESLAIAVEPSTFVVDFPEDPLEGPSSRTDGVAPSVDLINVPSRESRVSLTCSDVSELNDDVDDDEIMRSSSPPPSYDDVAHAGEAPIGAFGLAYGTI